MMLYYTCNTKIKLLLLNARCNQYYTYQLRKGKVNLYSLLDVILYKSTSVGSVGWPNFEYYIIRPIISMDLLMLNYTNEST